MTTSAIDPSVLSRRPPVDAESAPYVGLSALFHTMFLMIAMIVPPGAAHLELDDVEQRDRFVTFASKPEEKAPDFLEKQPANDEGNGEKAAAKHAGEEGAAGSPDSEQTNNRMAIEGPPDDVDLQVARRRDEQIARSAGIGSVLSSSSFLNGSADKTISDEAFSAIGGMDGNEVGPDSGAFGWGVTGGRTGGGGDDESYGMADVKTAGRASGTKDGEDYGKDAAELGDKEDKLPEPIFDPPTIEGPLDREIIQRVVRRHRRELAYCYQKELQHNPTLEGRVVMSFTISGNGSVISAMTKSNTMNNAGVGSCMAAKIRHWNFPAPSTGALVTVNYPFRFSKK